MNRSNGISSVEAKRGYRIFAMAVIVVGALFFLRRCLDNQFTNWDDQFQLLDNPQVHQLSFRNIKEVFSSLLVSEYHPLVTLIFTLEYRFFHLQPFPYHFHSLLLHLANGLLVFSLLLKLTRKIPTAFITAILFEIHPFQVQVVSWISGRKDLLFTLFYLSALLSYLTYRRGGGVKFYWFSFGLFVFSLLSKMLAVTFPAVLLFFDYLGKKKINGRDWREKIPFLCLALGGGWLTFKAQIAREAGSAAHLAFGGENVILACRNLIFYLTRLLLPVGLAPAYFFPKAISFWDSGSYFPFFLTVSGIVWLASFRGEKKSLLGGFGFFLITLFPVLRLIPFAGSEVVAHRFMYLPSLGLFSLAGWGFLAIFRRGGRVRLLGLVLSAVMVVSLGSLSLRRCRFWESSETL